MNVLDLFSGIGGFSLGLERAGMRTVAFCEIDPYCQAVLRKHWPNVPVYPDVREFTAEAISDAQCERWRKRDYTSRNRNAKKIALVCAPVDVICGGFPCQDISVAGKGAGIDGERSGLWSEYARIIGEVRPRYVIVENVSALLGRGIERVLGDLAALRYDAEWHCIPASAVGAPHRRDRVWIIAYRDKPGPPLRAMLARILSGTRGGCERQNASVGNWWLTEPDVGRVAHEFSPQMDGDLNATRMGTKEGRAAGGFIGGQILRAMRGELSPSTSSLGLQQALRRSDPMSEMPCHSGPGGRPSQEEANEAVQSVWEAILALPQQEAQDLQRRMSIRDWQKECDDSLGWWSSEPDVPRIAKGVANRVDRLRSLGNAIVPQIAEIIGKAIMGLENGAASQA